MISTEGFSSLLTDVGALKAAGPVALAKNLRIASDRLITAMSSMVVEDATFVETVVSTAAHLEANGNNVECIALLDEASRLAFTHKWSAATQLSLICARIRVAAILHGAGADDGGFSARISRIATTDTLKRFARAQLLLTAHIDATCCGSVGASVATRLTPDDRAALSGYAGCLADLFAAYSYTREERWDDCLASVASFRKAHQNGGWYVWFSDPLDSLGILAQYIGEDSISDGVLAGLELRADNVPRRLTSIVSFVSVAHTASMYAKFGHKTQLAALAADLENTERTAYIPAALGLGISAMNNAASGLYTADSMSAKLASVVNAHSARMLKPFVEKYLPDLLDAVKAQPAEGPTGRRYSFRALCESLSQDSGNDVHRHIWTSFMTHLHDSGDAIHNENLRMASVIARLCRFLGKTEAEILAISVDLLATPDFRRLARAALPAITLTPDALEAVSELARELVGWTSFEAFDRDRDRYTVRLQRMQANAKTAGAKEVTKAAKFLFQLTNLRRAIDEDTAHMLNSLSGH
jgi:hypothetical protein